MTYPLDPEPREPGWYWAQWPDGVWEPVRVLDDEGIVTLSGIVEEGAVRIVRRIYPPGARP